MALFTAHFIEPEGPDHGLLPLFHPGENHRGMRGIVIMSGVDERLYQAVQQNDIRAASEALEDGASANYIHRESDSSVSTDVAVLYVACENKNKDLVDLLLAGGADPNAEYSERAVWGSESRPCLLAAIPSIEIVRALLAKGADPNIPSVWREDRNNYRTALQAASGNQELIDLLKQYGDVGERLYQAVDQDDVRAAFEALEDGADANYIHRKRESDQSADIAVLSLACMRKNKDLVDLLLSGGADPNAGYSLSSTWVTESKPCLLAAIPYIEIVRALLEKGADPNIPGWLTENRTPQTALQAASDERELIDLLKQYGAR